MNIVRVRMLHVVDSVVVSCQDGEAETVQKAMVEWSEFWDIDINEIVVWDNPPRIDSRDHYLHRYENDQDKDVRHDHVSRDDEDDISSGETYTTGEDLIKMGLGMIDELPTYKD
jgi:hypothetical protein